MHPLLWRNASLRPSSRLSRSDWASTELLRCAIGNGPSQLLVGCLEWSRLLVMQAETPCPLCGDCRSREFKVVQEWQLVKCSVCLLVFLSPRPSLEQLEGLYGQEYFSGHIQKDLNEETAQQRVKQLIPMFAEFTRSVGKPGHLLEIGCGYGAYLAAARACGWETLGIEMSPHAAQVARQMYGLEIIQSSAEVVKDLSQKFDAVVMFSVVEHLANPLTVLRDVHERLSPRGLLWATAPNLGSLDRLFHGDHWSGWDLPFHLSHFTHQTIRRLLLGAGFRHVEIENRFFDPRIHLEVALRSRNLRADVRSWQIPDALSSSKRERYPEDLPARPQRSSKSLKPLRRLVKRIFSERDMLISAR